MVESFQCGSGDAVAVPLRHSDGVGQRTTPLRQATTDLLHQPCSPLNAPYTTDIAVRDAMLRQPLLDGVADMRVREHPCACAARAFRFT